MKNSKYLFYLTLLVMALAIFLGISSSIPQKSLGVDAPAHKFSGERALNYAKYLFKEEVPHYCGSEANRIVRDRIIKKLTSWGIETEIQKGFGHIFFERFAYAENIVATIPGKSGGKSFLMMAHYDSVRASMNSECDGAGVALLLELARTVKHGPQLEYDLIIFFADSEEVGLQGSYVYVKDNPKIIQNLMGIINFDNMKSGRVPSITARSKKSRFLEELFLKSGNIHLTSSAPPSFTMSRDPRNFGDFGSFVEAGVEGVHFGGSGGPDYHTPLENLSILEPNHLQNIGSRTISVLNRLEETGTYFLIDNHLVYFNLGPFFNISWPESANIPLIILGALLFILALFLLIKNQQLTFKKILWGFLNFLIIFGLSAGASKIINSLNNPPAKDAISYPATFLFYCIILWILPLLWSWIAVKLTGKSGTFIGLITGNTAGFIIIGFIFSLFFPGSIYILLIPMIAGVSLLLFTALSKNHYKKNIQIIQITIPLFLGIVMISELLIIIHESSGMGELFFPGLMAGLVGILFSPVLTLISQKIKKYFMVTTSLILGISLMIILTVSPYSKTHPVPMNINYLQDADTGKAFVFAPPLNGKTEELTRNLYPENLKTINRPYSEWLKNDHHIKPYYSGWVVKTEPSSQPIPEIEILDEWKTDQGRGVKIRLKSQRKANQVGLLLPPNTRRTRIKVNDLEHIYNGKGAPVWREYVFFAVPSEGMVIELDFNHDEKIQVFFFDCDFFLPKIAQPLIDLRPEWTQKKDKGDRWFIFKSTVL